jgi:hypothetical protein
LGEGDLLIGAVAVELVVDELGATVRVDAQQGERQAKASTLDGGTNVPLGLV